MGEPIATTKLRIEHALVPTPLVSPRALSPGLADFHQAPAVRGGRVVGPGWRIRARPSQPFSKIW